MMEPLIVKKNDESIIPEEEPPAVLVKEETQVPEELPLDEGEATSSLSDLIDRIKTGIYYIRHPRKKLPEYDPKTHGHLVEFEVPEGFNEVERYWVNEPYSFISILEKNNIYLYHVAEPMLTLYEKDILERVYDDLQDILSLGGIASRKDKEEILMENALILFNRYRASLKTPSTLRILYYLKRNFLGHDRINSLMIDPNIEDISCDGIGIPIFMYHNKYRNIKTNISFVEEELNSLVIKLCQKSGKHISISEPMVDATLPDGSRLQATLGKEITTRGSSFTIRKFGETL
ncbi:MAG: hypothetical protein R2741_00830 [Methanolobus sp.]